MRVPQIQIESQAGRVGLNTQKPTQRIDQPPADMIIEQPPAELFINRQPSRLTIDQTLARENLDLKSYRRRTQDNAMLGVQGIKNYVQKTVRDGNELMRIENGGDPIAAQAKRALIDETTFSTGDTPAQFSVKVEYTPAKVHVEWERHEPVMEVQINKPVHAYIPGATDVYMRQNPSLKIDFTI
ncbi:hypothetical protein CVD25_16685 [Bacillus canaveralius]|uniref:YviE n=1 Tax=Bacillus canaveralius TaxID=1403243 RepID=A0A2N5GMN2_9BACI|nr:MULTISPECIES: DUF6470 family protein [Bacillus]PLR82582.1 hypothetical protein CVD23_16645 [Bacillus sp. V33-4]PLR83159.1 hypothetical protein CU635_09760 [Bacillus canaveralius]PLR94077.1 hypothetical protein CVD25_16685 [Bacillus canaveralius]RSK54122.1 hypothetical protein EJA13_05970 [Bacillus canaveralius]